MATAGNDARKAGWGTANPLQGRFSQPRREAALMTRMAVAGKDARKRDCDTETPLQRRYSERHREVALMATETGTAYIGDANSKNRPGSRSSHTKVTALYRRLKIALPSGFVPGL